MFVRKVGIEFAHLFLLETIDFLGINALMEIMKMEGAKKFVHSNISHNERLEFLGDAVIEFITTVHLFFLFPDLEEGGLATYRSSLVQNKHLAVLAKVVVTYKFSILFYRIVFFIENRSSRVYVIRTRPRFMS